MAAHAATGDAYWISVGDWVHGPAARDANDAYAIRDRDGVPLYDYPDETAAILVDYFALQQKFPDRVLSLAGNHEWAHFGGPRTRKFHDDEAAFLEAQLAPAFVVSMRARFAAWPIVVLVPAIGLVLSHGALALSASADRARLGALALDRDDPIVQSAMFHYGHDEATARTTLAALSTESARYTLIVHGHDREEEGWVATTPCSALLCTSFGARQNRKAYLQLDLSRRLEGAASLREGVEIRRLYPSER